MTPPYFGTPATPLAMTELYKITLRSLQIIITIANAFDNTVILVYKIHFMMCCEFLGNRNYSSVYSY